MTELNKPYLPKDFIETLEGLCFAVVQQGTERCGGEDKVLCFLRYFKEISFSLREKVGMRGINCDPFPQGEDILKNDAEINGQWHKVTTEQANTCLKTHFPEYLHYSAILDAQLHAVATGRIIHHHSPRQRLQQILYSQQRDKVKQDLGSLCLLFQQNGLDLAQAGVTGSVLIGAQQQSSDIDLVFYDREIFHKARAITADLIGKQLLGNLGEKDWQEAYSRRSCTLSLQEYVWHECRKFNKGLINGRKFDLNFVDDQTYGKEVSYHKLGAITVQCRITEDRHSFDYPALYAIDHENIRSVVCFIATYTGQAVVDETVAISGLLEQAEDGSQRIVVGSSREAPGQYIKVIPCPN